MILMDMAIEYRQLLEMAEDPDVDPKTLADTLDMIETDIEDKVNGCAAVLEELDGDIEKLDNIIRRLQSRRKAFETSRDTIKIRMMMSMRLMGREVIKTALRTIRVMRNSIPSVILDVPDVWSVPEEYRRYKDPEVDTKKIGEAIKNGKDISFAHAEYGYHLRYK